MLEYGRGWEVEACDLIIPGLKTWNLLPLSIHELNASQGLQLFGGAAHFLSQYFDEFISKSAHGHSCYAAALVHTDPTETVASLCTTNDTIKKINSS